MLSFLIPLIGVLVGSVAYLISYSVEHASEWMRQPVQDLVNEGNPGKGYLVHSLWAIGLALFAAVLTLWAPQACGLLLIFFPTSALTPSNSPPPALR